MQDSRPFRFASRGLELAAYYWPAVGAARGALIFVHGWGEHAGRYQDAASALAAAGYAVYVLEFEGHGASPGRRAHVRRFDHLVADLASFIDEVRDQQPNLPLFLHGYSMGGCVAATFAVFISPRLDGLILNASALWVSPHISPAKKNISRFLGGLLPYLPVAKLTYGELMSRLPEEIAAYDADPRLWQGKINAGTGKELLQANERISRHLHRLRLPLLVLQGSDDRLVDPAGAEDVYNKATSPDKQFHMYEGARHDLLHESNRAEVLDHIRTWLDDLTNIDVEALRTIPPGRRRVRTPS